MRCTKKFTSFLRQHNSLIWSAFKNKSPQQLSQKISLPVNDILDLQKAYHDSGMFYTFFVDRLYKTKSLRTNNTIGIEICELHAHDIDSIEDWKLAELKYTLSLNEKF